MTVFYRDADFHDAFTDALATGPDIFDSSYMPPAHVDASRLAEARDGWLGSQPGHDPRDDPEPRACVRCGASEAEFEAEGCGRPSHDCGMRGQR